MATALDQKVAELLATEQDVFIDVVWDDIREDTSETVHQALRDNRLIERWRETLRAIQTDLILQVKTRRSDSKRVGHLSRLERSVALARADADWRCQQKVLRVQEENRKAKEERKKGRDSEDQVRQRASNAAKRRLISAHWEEFQGYLNEELELRGLSDNRTTER